MPNKIMVPDEYAIACRKCGKGTFIPLSQLLSPNISYNDVKSSCQNCGELVDIPNIPLVKFGDQYVPLPNGSTLNNRFEVLRKTIKERYFGISDIHGNIISGLWKIWKNADDIYIINRSFSFLKISFHSTGQNILAITRESWNREKYPLPHREIIKYTRARPHEAHVCRVLVINIRFDHRVKTGKLSDIKKKIIKNLYLFNIDGSNTVQFVLYYTRGHPDRYLETCTTDSNLVSIMEGSRGDFFSLIISNNTSLFYDGPLELPYVAFNQRDDWVRGRDSDELWELRIGHTGMHAFCFDEYIGKRSQRQNVATGIVLNGSN